MNVREAHNAKQLGKLHKKELVAEILRLRGYMKRWQGIESAARDFAQQYYEPWARYQDLCAALAAEEEA